MSSTGAQSTGTGLSGICKEIPSIIANQNLLTLHYQLSINSLIIILSIISNIQLLDVMPHKTLKRLIKPHNNNRSYICLYSDVSNK